MKNRIFIDLGANKGSSIDWCEEHYENDCLIYAFEPNPVLFQNLVSKYSDRVMIFNYAAWTRNEKKKLRIAENDISSTFYKHVSIVNAIFVNAIDFSTWLRDTMINGDVITLKMNIEGAEFPVLMKMIEDRTINLIGELYYQFHPNMKPKPAVNSAKNLIDIIESRGILCQKWIGAKQTKRIDGNIKISELPKFGEQVGHISKGIEKNIESACQVR